MYIHTALQELDGGLQERYRDNEPIMLVMDGAPDFIVTKDDGQNIEIAQYVFSQGILGDCPIRNIVSLGYQNSEKLYPSLLFNASDARRSGVYGVGADAGVLFGIAEALGLPYSVEDFRSVE